MRNKILLGLAVVLVVIQFIRPAKNLGATDAPTDITALYPTPPAVKAVLAKACYDCHSDHTRYPWYAEVQPVGWWLASHVNDGKRHLNFSQFGTYTAKRADHKLHACLELLDHHEMPLASYTLIHRDAILTAEETTALSDWITRVRAAAPPAR